MAALCYDSALADPSYRGDLGNGLVIRWSTKADTEKIAHLMANVFRDGPNDPPNTRAADETRRLMGGTFPFMGPGDYAIVEDSSRADSPVIAAAAYWRLLWNYDGISFGVGRPENIGTDPAYRKRGLVRALLDMIHARSAAEGNLVDAITGIPYFYRQFGYEYVFDLGGRQTIPTAALPAPKQEPSPYSLRPATMEDIPKLMWLYQLRRKDSLVWHETTEAYWRYQVGSWEEVDRQGLAPSEAGLFSRTYMIVEGGNVGGTQRVCGYMNLAAVRWGKAMRIFGLMLEPTMNWQATVPWIVQLVHEVGLQMPDARTEPEPLSEIVFFLGRKHPAYLVLDPAWGARVEVPYAWYVRVADLPAFLRLIAPILEKRLAHSPLIGYSGELHINFYRSELHIKFEEGKLQEVVTAPADPDSDAKVECPPLVFLQLLFSYRSEAELRDTFPDVMINPQARLLVNTLFPKQHSIVNSLL